MLTEAAMGMLAYANTGTHPPTHPPTSSTSSPPPPTHPPTHQPLGSRRC